MHIESEAELSFTVFELKILVKLNHTLQVILFHSGKNALYLILDFEEIKYEYITVL